MENVVLYIKSYGPDLKRSITLLESIDKYNSDNIPVYMSVNDSDYTLFKRKVSSSVNLLKDSDIVECKIADGWRYQQVVKAQLHRLKICKNYLCLDSDSEFIRDFYKSDFIYKGDTPYTLMHEHKYILNMMEIIGIDSVNTFHVKALKALRELWGTSGKNWDYGPSPYIWSTKVWEHFYEKYLLPRNHTFESFFIELEKTSNVIPSESMIYGEYLFKTRLIDILPVEGFFKVYFFRKQYEIEKKYNKVELLKRNYLGVIMQSNWNKKRSLIDFGSHLQNRKWKILSDT